MNKKEYLEDLQSEYRGWEELLARIGEERGEDRMEQPGVAGRWSVKDVVAHLTGWRRRTVARLQAAGRGLEEPPPPWPAQLQEDDEINAWLYETNRDRPVSEVLADSREVFAQLAAALEAFSVEELLDPQRFPWTEGQPLTPYAFFAHFHEEHEADLRAWLEKLEGVH